MNKRRILGVTFIALGISLGFFQALLIGIAAPKGYWLIHEGQFYAINYGIILFLVIAGAVIFTAGYLKWSLLLVGIVLLTANTTFFYYMGDVNLLIAESEDGEHEVVIKEYPKMKKETVRLKRRGIFFGREDSVLAGSSEYKALEEERYKIEWSAGDIAELTYETGYDGALNHQIYNFRSSDYISYQNVIVSLIGKWMEQGNPQNYFMSDNNELVYAKDGQLYYYNIQNTEQFGIYSVVVLGDETKPTLSIILNPGTEFGDDGLIAEGGTITITPVDLGETESAVYERE
ncbi:hypothetical protein [Planomicrobium sp. CPCC 101110]|uniref:hypothetical protein n=1 Tax=Planomicrobium sp. CPCC 101110 TaxID=2599619 RepID=UPI0011B3721C|nr:hypothetical protein [Planomicrobium sp. CPCC 101110]TWT25293.1 hypothetical protein FQV30_13090 [Planomicrobium sp. CPCC 101110]